MRRALIDSVSEYGIFDEEGVFKHDRFAVVVDGLGAADIWPRTWGGGGEGERGEGEEEKKEEGGAGRRGEEREGGGGGEGGGKSRTRRWRTHGKRLSKLPCRGEGEGRRRGGGALGAARPRNQYLCMRRHGVERSVPSRAGDETPEGEGGEGSIIGGGGLARLIGRDGALGRRSRRGQARFRTTPAWRRRERTDA